MKKFYILILGLFLSGSISYAAYFNDDIPQGAGVYGESYSNSSLSNSNLSHYSRIGNTYYSPSGVSYTRQGDKIYGSDGSSYTQFGNIIQNNAPHSQSYQINNNLIQPLY